MSRRQPAKQRYNDKRAGKASVHEVDMSNLQIGLILIGALFVGGMLIFNWWQQRSHRRKTESLFESKHEDVLLGDFKPSAVRDDRVEHEFFDFEDKIVAEEPILMESPVAEIKSVKHIESPSHFVDSEI